MVRPDARVCDVHIASPASDRWTVEELDDLVVAPSRLVPLDKSIIVVFAADNMDASCAEHLLKVVEEPHEACFFIFAVRSTASLLPTIQSRVSHALNLSLPSPREYVRVLQRLGATQENASRAVSILPDMHALCLPASLDEAVLEKCEVLRTPLVSSTPSETACYVASTLEDLASIADPLGATPSRGAVTAEAPPAKKASDTVIKARTRVLARKLLDNWRDSLQSELSRPDLSREVFAKVESASHVLDEADSLLTSYASVRNVLSMVMVSCSASST